MLERPQMPDVTPTTGVGTATVALFLGVVATVDTPMVQVAAIVGAALVAVAIALADAKVREARNGTEQARIGAMAAEPSGELFVVHTEDAE